MSRLFLHVDVQLFQHCLLRELSFTHCIAFASLAKSSQLYLWRTISELHKIKRLWLLGIEAMTNLDNILKSRGIILLRKVLIVKAMVFPVVMYGCENWTVKKAECRTIDAGFFKLIH